MDFSVGNRSTGKILR